MKIIKTLLLSSLLTPAFGQIIADLGPEISAGDGSTYGNLRPRMAITDDGPVILLSKGGGGALSVAKWNGTGFDTPVDILPAGMETYASTWTGADIAAAGNNVVVVFKSTPVETGRVYAVRSTDGGVTFSDTIRVENHMAGIAWMPSLDIDAAGNPTVTYMIHDANWTNPRYAIARSTDGGQTFLAQQEIAGGVPGEACDCCPAEVAVSGNKSVLLFRNNDANLRDIYGVLSVDGGATFGSEANIDNTNWIVNSCPSTGPDGRFVGNTLFTTYASRSTGDYRVYVSRSDASGVLTYTDRATIIESETNTSSQNFPRISSWGDTVAVAWQENKGSNADIYVSITTNNGTDMLTELSLNPFLANENTLGVQSYPDVIIENGMLHLCYSESLSGDVVYRRGLIGQANTLELNESNIVIAPNPSATGKFSLSGEKINVAKVTDQSGKEVPFTLTNNEININADQGVYFLTGTTHQGTNVVRKLVIQ